MSDKIGYSVGSTVVDVSVEGVAVAMLPPNRVNVGGVPNDGKPVISFTRIGAIVGGATDGASVNVAGDGVDDVGGKVAGIVDDGDTDG